MPKPILHTALFHYPHHLSMMLAHADGNLHLAGAHHGGNLVIDFYRRLAVIRFWFAGLSFRTKALAALATLALPASALMVSFLLPQNVAFSFAGNNCFSNPTLLPSFTKPHGTELFTLNQERTVALADYPLYSAKTCVSMNDKPAAQTTQKLAISAGFLSKHIYVAIGELPQLSLSYDENQPVSPSDGLQFSLNQPDNAFSYLLQIDEAVKPCDVAGLTITCPLEPFNLPQGTSHEIAIRQQFNASSDIVLTSSIKLRDPIRIEQTSIANEQIVYDTPDRISITTNKPVKDAGSVRVLSGDQPSDVTIELTDSGFAIVFNTPLARESDYLVELTGIQAVDGAYLPEPYSFRFYTSGGPKVTGINISSYNVAPDKTIVLSFDSPVSTTQPLTSVMSLAVGSNEIGAAITASGSTITINPTDQLPACTAFSISVSNELQNAYGIAGNSAWNMQSRTTCKQVFSIGSSVQGRALTAYRFGSGATSILFVGGMHGDEKSSYRTLIAWVDELERNYPQIPADKSVIVIPDINPDAYAASSRLNANGVDLNRNFPSNDWTSGVYIPGNRYLETGGGTSPLSEPESNALATYVNQIQPRVVLTYHAVARAVIANGVGDSVALTDLYANESDFSSYTSGNEDVVFGYATTGEFETWLADKKAIPTLLVELATLSSNELYTQRSAMWAMLRI